MAGAMTRVGRPRLVVRQIAKLPGRAVLGNVVARLVALVSIAAVTILVARTGGAEDVGLLALMRVLPGLVGVLAAAGLPSATGYFVAGAHAENARLWPTIGMVMVAGGILGTVVWAVLTPTIHQHLMSNTTQAVVLGVGATVATQLPVSVGKSALQATGDSRGANVATATEEAAFIPAWLLAWAVGLRGGWLLVVALLVADVVVAAWAWVRIARRARMAGRSLSGRPDRELAIDLVRFGARSQVGGLVMLLNLRLDVIVLGLLAGPAPVGVYVVASKFAEFLRLPALALSWVIYPRVAREGIALVLTQARRWLPRLLLLGAAAAAVLGASSFFVLPVLYGEEFVDAGWPTVVLSLGLLLQPVAGVATGFLMGAGRRAELGHPRRRTGRHRHSRRPPHPRPRRSRSGLGQRRGLPDDGLPALPLGPIGRLAGGRGGGALSRVRSTLASVLLATALGAALGACTSQGQMPVLTGAGGLPREQYVALADAVLARGGRVWVEADLVKAWQAGPERYGAVLGVVAAFVARPGITGVKIADEFGYEDGLDAAEAAGALRSMASAIRDRAPARRVLIDVVVPELGCLAWQESAPPGTAGAAAWAAATPTSRREMERCAATEAARNPAATIAAVDGYVRDGGIDVLDLSAGLRDAAEYAAWGTTRDAAMAAIWAEASRRWGADVTLQARKALAHDGRYDKPAASAQADVHTYVDLPLANGAQAVDVWTWSQPYRGRTHQLTDPGLVDNALVSALRERRERGASLWTHMTPSSLQRGLEADVQAATSIFGTIFVTSGTG